MYEVAVAGGSSAGMAVAGLLAREGFEVVVLEPQPARSTVDWDLRTVALTPHSMGILDSLGFNVSSGRAAFWQSVVVEEADSPVSLSFQAGEMGIPFLGCLLELAQLNAGLGQVLDNMAVSMITGRGRFLEQIAQGVRVHLEDSQVVEAALLVAADGAQSWVRDQLGIAQRVHVYQQTAIVAVVECDRPHNGRAWQRFSQGYPLAFLPLADVNSCRYSLVWSVPDSFAQKLLTATDAQFMAQLHQHMAAQLGEIRHLSSRDSYPLIARHALSYYAGSAVLVGDSAHTIHPLAGQGLNLGFSDIAVLVEELVRARTRRLPLSHPSVLGRYQRRRWGANQRMQTAMTELQRIMGSDRPLVRVLRSGAWSVLDQQRWLKGLLVDRVLF